MRIPFPSRIPLPPVFLGAGVLASLQQLQHTSLAFTVYSFLFIIIATVAFNVAGGFTRPSGSYVFFYATLTIIVGIVYKAYLGEPGDSNLRSPILTMQVFTGGITAMLVAVVVSSKISRKRPLLENFLKDKDIKNASIGCFAVGSVLIVLSFLVPHEDSSILSAVAQLNRFYQMAIILATIHVIKKTGGRSGINLTVLVFMAVCTFLGALFFSKEGMFIPLFCWMVAAASMRLNLPTFQVVVGALAIFFMFHFLVPYAQYGRDRLPDDADIWQRTIGAIGMLTDLQTVRGQYLDQVYEMELDEDGTSMDYYDRPQGFFDRLTMIGPDDALIDYTSRGNYTGIQVLPAYFANWIPHVLWPSKPVFGAGNFYAHKIGGILADDDLSTGISFSPSGEAYQLAGWTGVFVIAPLIWIMLFTVFDSLCGDTRKSPWGLLVIPIFAHLAPENMLSGAVYATWYGSLAIVFVAFASAYVMPLLGTLLAGPEKTVLVRSKISMAVPAASRRNAARLPV